MGAGKGAAIVLGVGAAGLLTYWGGVAAGWWKPIPNPFAKPAATPAQQQAAAQRAAYEAAMRARQGRDLPNVPDPRFGELYNSRGYTGSSIGSNRERRATAQFAYSPLPPLNGAPPVPGGPGGETEAANRAVLRRLFNGSGGGG